MFLWCFYRWASAPYTRVPPKLVNVAACKGRICRETLFCHAIRSYIKVNSLELQVLGPLVGLSLIILQLLDPEKNWMSPIAEG